MKKNEFNVQVKVIKTFKRIKTINLRIRKGEVEVLCPYFTSESYIKDLIKRKKEWINMSLKNSHRIEKEREHIRNGMIMYKGSYLRVVHKEDIFQKIILRKKILEINSNIIESEKKYNLIINWLKSESKKFLTKRIDIISKRVGIKYKSIKIKPYRSRWGSCSILGEISLNWKLIMLPVSVIDYVIIHELAHVIFPNHSNDFWNLVRNKDPKYNIKNEWLKKNGLIFINLN